MRAAGSRRFGYFRRKGWGSDRCARCGKMNNVSCSIDLNLSVGSMTATKPLCCLTSSRRPVPPYLPQPRELCIAIDGRQFRIVVLGLPTSQSFVKPANDLALRMFVVINNSMLDVLASVDSKITNTGVAGRPKRRRVRRRPHCLGGGVRISGALPRLPGIFE